MPQLIRRSVEADETYQAQQSLKIRIPERVELVEGVAWRPTPNNFLVDINRDIIKLPADLGEFIWEFRDLPEGVTSCLPELYDQRVFLPEVEVDKNGEEGIFLFQYSVQSLSRIAHEIRDKLAIIEVEKRKKAKESPILTANNHLKLELFHVSKIAEDSYNKFTQPPIFRLEKDRNNTEDENRRWITFGIYEDSQRLTQIFEQFPHRDRMLFENYEEININLQELKTARRDKHTLSKKLALSYDLILIAKKSLPNKMQFVRTQVESADFGKLRMKE